MSTPTFASLGVPAPLAAALSERGITEPFPIQTATIPDALAGRDVCGKAPTGSGKTLAFGLPLLARVTRSAPKRPKGLVLVPTRELALQVADALRAVSGDTRVLAVYGGAGIQPQMKALRNGVDVVVACPGRLLDLIDRRCCDLRDVSVAVVDEADRMADMGFLPDVRRLLDDTPGDRQTVLFSATLDGAIDALVREYQVDPVVHETAPEQTGDVVHHVWVSERQGRATLAADIVQRSGSTVVFCRTRHGSDRVAKQLRAAGVEAAAIHGARSQAQRERALQAFHRGEVRALVATDVAARGIHVEGVSCVLHFDIPADHKDYVHRSGRTGRAGADGTVVALVAEAQRRDAAKLLRAAGVDADLAHPDLELLPAGPGSAVARRPRPASGDAATRSRTGGPSGGPRRDSGPRGSARAGDGASPRGRSARPGPARSGDRASAGGRSPRPGQDRAGDGAPKGGRPARSGQGRPGDGARPGASNRAERRRERFGPPGSPERSQRAEEKRLERPGAGARGKAGTTRTAGPGGDAPRTLPDGTPGEAKVRPSGASRRKARRQALAAEGVGAEPVAPTGGRRPRPHRHLRG